MFMYRAASESDLAGICALGQVINLLHHEAWPRIFAPASAPERDAQHWRRCITGENVAAFVAEDSSTLVGFVTVAVVSEGHSLLQPMRYAKVGSVCVREAERGKGIGRRLMEQAESWAVAQSAVDVRLNVWEFNRSALGLYRELGYEVRSLLLGKSLLQDTG
jgi:ribosomal protein S18 acetylase RimI-like enzyme